MRVFLNFALALVFLSGFATGGPVKTEIPTASGAASAVLDQVGNIPQGLVATGYRLDPTTANGGETYVIEGESDFKLLDRHDLDRLDVSLLTKSFDTSANGRFAVRVEGPVNVFELQKPRDSDRTTGARDKRILHRFKRHHRSQTMGELSKKFAIVPVKTRAGQRYILLRNPKVIVRPTGSASSNQKTRPALSQTSAPAPTRAVLKPLQGTLPSNKKVPSIPRPPKVSPIRSRINANKVGASSMNKALASSATRLSAKVSSVTTKGAADVLSSGTQGMIKRVPASSSARKGGAPWVISAMEDRKGAILVRRKQPPEPVKKETASSVSATQAVVNKTSVQTEAVQNAATKAEVSSSVAMATKMSTSNQDIAPPSGVGKQHHTMSASRGHVSKVTASKHQRHLDNRAPHSHAHYSHIKASPSVPGKGKVFISGHPQSRRNIRLKAQLTKVAKPSAAVDPFLSRPKSRTDSVLNKKTVVVINKMAAISQPAVLQGQASTGTQSKPAVQSQRSVSVNVKTVKTVVSSEPVNPLVPGIAASLARVQGGPGNQIPQSAIEPVPAAVGAKPAITTTTTATTTTDSTAAPQTTTTEPTTTTTEPTTTTTTEAPEEPPTTEEAEEMEAEDRPSTTTPMPESAKEQPAAKPPTVVVSVGQATTESALGPNDRVNTTDVPEEIEPGSPQALARDRARKANTTFAIAQATRTRDKGARVVIKVNNVTPPSTNDGRTGPSGITEEPEDREEATTESSRWQQRRNPNRRRMLRLTYYHPNEWWFTWDPV